MLAGKLLMRVSPGIAWALLRRRFEPQNWERRNGPARELVSRAKPLVGIQQAILWGLQTDGVVSLPLSRLVEDEAVAREARRAAIEALDRPKVNSQIERRWSSSGAKWYVVRGLGLGASRRLPDGLARLVLDRHLLGVVNGYLGVAARLHYVDAWHNFPVRAADPAISAESWHRDHEDISVLKVAFMLDGVCPDSGPLFYVRGSQPGGPLADLCPAFSSIGARPRAAEVEAVIALGQVTVCTGAPGDLLLWDGVGLHHGGRARRRDRRVVIASYTSDVALGGCRYRASESVVHDLDESGRYALRLAPSRR